MLRITLAARVNGKKVSVRGHDVAFVVAAWNKCWWAQPGAGRLQPSDNKLETLVGAVLQLPTDLGATVTFGHQ